MTLSDVHPNGYAQVLRQNILRARYCEGDERPVLLKPAQAYRYSIEMYPVSNLFRRGHRIRLSVTSSSFPKWYPNGNTGCEIDQDMPPVIAINSVFHDRERPSRLILPIVPTQSQPSEPVGRH